MKDGRVGSQCLYKQQESEGQKGTCSRTAGQLVDQWGPLGITGDYWGMTGDDWGTARDDWGMPGEWPGMAGNDWGRLE